jgi:hypothetical protein
MAGRRSSADVLGEKLQQLSPALPKAVPVCTTGCAGPPAASGGCPCTKGSGNPRLT